MRPRPPERRTISAMNDLTADTSETPLTSSTTGTTRVKRGMAEMLKGGVIMDVVTAEQAKIA